MPPWLTLLLSGAGASGVLAGLGRLFYNLHKDAVQAQRERADDARARAEAAEERNKILQEQIRILLGGTPGEKP